MRSLALMLVLCAFCGVVGASEINLAFTADTEGHVWPGDCCGQAGASGCLPRRATVLAGMRKASAETLVLDAGNFLFGPGSADSKGKVMVDGYGLLGYSVANISYRDFRFGKAQTLEVLKEAKFTPVSANLLDDQGKLLFKPYVVKESAGQKVAILGLTELPAGLAKLPHVAQQLEGMTVQPAAHALAQWLPKAKAEAQQVVVLYYGTPAGLKEVCEKAGADAAVVLAGGIRPDQLPKIDAPAVAATAEFGQQVASVKLSADKPQVTQVPVSAKVVIDEPTKKQLSAYMPKSTDLIAAAAGPATTPPSPSPGAQPSPTPAVASPSALIGAEALKSGPAKCSAEEQSKGLVLKVKQVELSAGKDEVTPSSGGTLAVLETEWTNRLGMAQEISDLPRHVYLIVNGRTLCRLHEDAGRVKGALRDSLEFKDKNQVLKGSLVFDCPVKDVQSLELRYYDTTSGDIVLPLVGGKAPQAPKIAHGPVSNQALELAAYTVTTSATWGEKKAPVGKTFVVVDLAAKSVSKDNAGKSVFARMPEWRKYTYMVVDGAYAYSAETGGAWHDEFLALPAVSTGGQIAYLVPEKHSLLALRMDFPNLDTEDKSAALVLQLEGKADVAPAAKKPIASVKDDMFKVDFVSQDVASTLYDNYPESGKKFLLLEVSVFNTGKSGQWFQTHAQIRYSLDKNKELEMDDLTQSCHHPARDNVWVPAGQSRVFQMVFEVPSADKMAQVKFTGGNQQKVLQLLAMSMPEANSPAKPETKVPTPTPAAVTPKPTPVAVTPAATPAAPVPSITPTPAPSATEPSVAVATAPAAPATQQGPRVIPSVKSGDVIVFDPSLKPKGLAGVGLTQDEVNKAIIKGRQYLWKDIKAELSKDRDYFKGRPEVLACLALEHAGLTEEVPEFSAVVKKTLLQSTDLNYTYLAAIRAMLAEASGDEDCRVVMNMVARYLVEAQGPAGTWGYQGDTKGIEKIMSEFKVSAPPAISTAVFKVQGGRPIVEEAAGEVFKRTTPPNIGSNGDNSVTQFAVLGLWTASRNGLKIDQDIWKKCLDATRKRQQKDGSCGYEGGSGYGSMTCAFICTSAIADSYLGDDPFQDRGIHRAIAWLSQNWSVKENPKHGQYLYYYIYSIERVGRILDVDFIGDKEWYPLGARYLVDNQRPDGGWGEKRSTVEETSFALLFLTKATATLAPAARGGDGTLATSGPSVRADRVYIILDASTSMLEQIDGKDKFKVAQEALESIIKALPDQTQVALRVYGNRFKEHPNGPDEDSTLEIPLAKVDKKAVMAKLEDLIPRGRTPLAYSMEQAAEDLKKARVTGSTPVSVVLLTDGWESTAKKRDPVEAAKALAAVDGAMLNVVGLDVNVADEVKQLQAIAKAGKGEYWAAGSSEKLIAHLKKTIMSLPGRFQVFDSSGQKIADGVYGQNITLKEGKYVLKAVIEGKEVEQPFWINTGKTTTLTYEQSKPDEKTPPSKVTPTPAKPTPAKPTPTKPSPKPSPRGGA